MGGRGSDDDDDGGVLVDGFVAILRQLGDLAQLAAEVFQGMHDQVMAVSTRGRQLTLRLNQLDHAAAAAQDSSSSSSFFCHKDYYLFVASNIDRVHWRANLILKQGVVAGGNNSLPSIFFERIDRCRGPPKLSLLDKYDADGEGACLKRYTNPSFFTSYSACSTKLIHQRIQMAKQPPKLLLETKPTFQSSDSDNSRPQKASQCSDSMPEMDASHGFLSMFRQLKYRQTNGSPRPQMHNFQNEASSSGLNISLNCSPESNIKVTQDIAASTTGTDPFSEERNLDLERTSSFEAWLSPNAHNIQHDQIAEEMPHYTCNNGFVNHVTPNDAIGATNNANCKDDSNTYKKAVSKRSRYKGGMEFIASRVSSFPRKLFAKKQDPHPLSVADSFRNMTSKILELKCNNIRDNDSNDMGSINREELLAGENGEHSSPDALFHHVSTERRYMHATRASSEDVPALAEVASDEKAKQEHSDDAREASYDKLLDEELHQSVVRQERNGSSVPQVCSTTRFSQQECEVPGKDMVPPLPPMQWLSSIKVHSGSTVASSPRLKTLRPQSPAVLNQAGGRSYSHPVRKQLETDNVQARGHFGILASHTEMAQTSASDVKSAADISNTNGICRYGFPGKDSEEIRHQEKDIVQPSEGEILKTTEEICEPTVQSDESPPEQHSEIQPQREEIHQTGNGDSDCNNRRNLRASTEVPTHSSGPQIDVHNSLDHPTDRESNTNVHVESVFFSAVEQLTKMNPPPVPRPKYSILQVGFQDRSTVRTAPGLIYPSRRLSGEICKLPEQINAKVSYDLKPALERSSNVTVDHSNTKVATILQRVDHIRQAHADNYDIDSEVSWSDSD
uniref:Protein SCAR n=1 Tax=Oryza punctata TaxID=4537 RepID=A0A0E0LQ39_ORYPU